MLWKLVENVKYEDIYEVTLPSICLCREKIDLLDMLLGNNGIMKCWTLLR